MTNYIQDPINGQFKAQKSEWLSQAQWDELCERWGQSPRRRTGFIRKMLFIGFVVAFVFWIV